MLAPAVLTCRIAPSESGTFEKLCNKSVMAADSAYFLIEYPRDKTFSVISSRSKNIIQRIGDAVKVNWPKLGVFDGKIIDEGSNLNLLTHLFITPISFFS